jgi:hypothetical protein
MAELYTVRVDGHHYTVGFPIGDAAQQIADAYRAGKTVEVRVKGRRSCDDRFLTDAENRDLAAVTAQLLAAKKGAAA